MGIAPRRLTRQRGHSFGIGQERPKAGASRQWKGCESLPESQHCRQRREEYCSCEIAYGLNWEDPPSPTLKNARWLWGYSHSVGKLEVSLQCQLLGVRLSCPSREGDHWKHPASSLRFLSCSVGYTWPQHSPPTNPLPDPEQGSGSPERDLPRAATGTIGLQRLGGSSHSLLFP